MTWTLDVPGAQADRLRPHFDAAYYRREYPDLEMPAEALLDHFCRIGWQEGRNPTAAFDTVAYLVADRAVAASGLNPYLHYIVVGREERRVVARAVSPSLGTLRLFGRSITDWVERLRPHVDIPFYKDVLGAARAALERVDIVAHFAFRGWREGLSPNARFDTRHWLASHPDVMAAGVNPLLAALERPDVTAEVAHRPRTRGGAPLSEPDERALVAREFATAFYLRNHPDAAASGLDPLDHYLTIGWRHGHRPNESFDTAYYLRMNVDVAEAGLNPFWHYVTEGRKEGRMPGPPGGRQRGLIDAARAPDAPTPRGATTFIEGYDDPVPLCSRIAAPGAGLVVSLSHDRYTISVGGTQIFIADEQRKFNRLGWTYLHLSPVWPALRVFEETRGFQVWATVDGQPAGCFDVVSLASALARQPDDGGQRRILVLHSLLGFDADAVLALAGEVAPDQAFYWLHDYSSLCSGFNLLRNDYAFCHAPPVGSLGCRICAHGALRDSHVRIFARLLSELDVTLVAPSEAAAAVWREGATVGGLSPVVHPHWMLRRVPSQDRSPQDRSPQGRPRRGRRTVRTLAFVGHPFASKGWPAFHGLVDRLGDDPKLRFLHFASEDTAALPGVVFVPTRVTAGDRHATIERLRTAAVDAVLILSPWPETFSFVAHEAIAAGCVVFCLAVSGNVAAIVRQTGRGQVFADEEEIATFIGSGAAAAFLARADAEGDAFEIDDVGTTATLIPSPAFRIPAPALQG